MSEHTCARGLGHLFKTHWEGLLCILAPVAFAPLLLQEDQAYKCMYTLLVMAVYWIVEVIPLGITSIIPMFMFPLFDIMTTERICLLYFKNVMFMFLASIMVAASVEFSNLHVRIALIVIKILGCSPLRLHLSVAFVSMFLSMWITNSAATALMCPIITAILDELESQAIVKAYHPDDYGLPKRERRPSQLSLCYFLGAAYSSSIGGCGILIGTPTNLVYKNIYEGRFPTSKSKLDFGTHMMYAVPISIGITITVFLAMEIVYVGLFRPNSKAAKESSMGKEGAAIGQKVVDEKYASLGAMSAHEITIAILFTTLVFLYVFMSPGFVKGWADHFACGKGIKTATPTAIILLLMFAMPTNYKFLKFWSTDSLEKSNVCLEWLFVLPKLPWNLGFVIGSGASLSEAIKVSGMAKLLGDWLSALDVLPPSTVLLVCILVATFLTNLSANVAVCNVIVPVLAELSVSCKIHPIFLIVPVGIACSFAFMLPVGTPANAIVQAHANIQTMDMVKGGFIPSLVASVTLWILSMTYGAIVYPDMHSYPSWADD